ncbi:hypothetical protein SMG44B_20495 [Stenotrophomonas maltophilia]
MDAASEGAPRGPFRLAGQCEVGLPPGVLSAVGSGQSIFNAQLRLYSAAVSAAVPFSGSSAGSHDELSYRCR